MKIKTIQNNSTLIILLIALILTIITIFFYLARNQNPIDILPFTCLDIIEIAILVFKRK